MALNLPYNTVGKTLFSAILYGTSEIQSSCKKRIGVAFKRLGEKDKGGGY